MISGVQGRGLENRGHLSLEGERRSNSNETNLPFPRHHPPPLTTSSFLLFSLHFLHLPLLFIYTLSHVLSVRTPFPVCSSCLPVVNPVTTVSITVSGFRLKRALMQLLWESELITDLHVKLNCDICCIVAAYVWSDCKAAVICSISKFVDLSRLP